MTDERMLELRFKMWALAQNVMTETANTRAMMPGLTDEEYGYAREFLLGIAKHTKPGGHREDYDDDDEFWCGTCQEHIESSHYHCGVCNEVCTLVGHPECRNSSNGG